jgi:hypothetical protein
MSFDILVKSILVVIEFISSGIIFLITNSENFLLALSNATDFCILVLFLATFLNSFISSIRLLVLLCHLQKTII